MKCPNGCGAEVSYSARYRRYEDLSGWHFCPKVYEDVEVMDTMECLCGSQVAVDRHGQKYSLVGPERGLELLPHLCSLSKTPVPHRPPAPPAPEEEPTTTRTPETPSGGVPIQWPE